jgi:hypothetical protein
MLHFRRQSLMSSPPVLSGRSCWVFFCISAVIGHLIGILGAWRRQSLFDIVMPLCSISSGHSRLSGLDGIHLRYEAALVSIKHAFDDKLIPGFKPGIYAEHPKTPDLASHSIRSGDATDLDQQMRNTMVSVLTKTTSPWQKPRADPNRIMFRLCGMCHPAQCDGLASLARS